MRVSQRGQPFGPDWAEIAGVRREVGEDLYATSITAQVGLEAVSNYDLRIRGILRQVAADFEANCDLLRQNRSCRETRSTDRVIGRRLRRLRRSGPNQGENRRCKATEPGGTGGRIQIRGRILEPNAMARRLGGAARGSDSRGVSQGMGRRVRPRGWGVSEVWPFPLFPACCAHSEHAVQRADLVSLRG
jgi:hypothetical protein